MGSSESKSKNKMQGKSKNKMQGKTIIRIGTTLEDLR